MFFLCSEGKKPKNTNFVQLPLHPKLILGVDKKEASRYYLLLINESKLHSRRELIVEKQEPLSSIPRR